MGVVVVKGKDLNTHHLKDSIYSGLGNIYSGSSSSDASRCC